MTRIHTSLSPISWDNKSDSAKIATEERRPPSSRPGSPLDGLRQADEPPGTFVRRGAIRRGRVKADRSGALSPTPSGSSRSSGSSVSSTSTAVPLTSLSQPPQTRAAHYEKRAMPTDSQSLGRLRCDAQLASFPYKRDPESLPTGWSPQVDLADRLRDGIGLKLAGVERGAGAIIDRDSGLTAVVLHNRETREVVLAFGGTSSGKKVKGALAERSGPKGNFMSTLSQWGANFHAGIGGTPKSYRQGADLLASMQDRLLSDPALAGHTVRVVGHSKGGGEAMYAALKTATPVPVTAFCPAHLSDGLIKQLPQGNLARAKELIQTYSPYGDPVAGMRGKLPGVPGVGVGHHFDGIPGSGAASLHSQFRKHVLHYCDEAQSPKRA
jgi:hypothetical protein